MVQYFETLSMRKTLNWKNKDKQNGQDLRGHPSLITFVQLIAQAAARRDWRAMRGGTPARPRPKEGKDT
ncbi:MAG: hypothetical protein AAGI03_06245 [Pseudomonadota bacterium]